MKSGTCPKCGSTDVRFRKGTGYRSCLAVTHFTGTNTADYVCPDCGFIESYVADPGVIAKRIREKWPRVKE
jgi:Zn finger protein HypA/HybF involved in hydrogenase expression